ncbi:MAG TPA: Flp family type IVb pilin [Caulobacteraceae bacterium]
MAARFALSESGATAMEYGLMAALIAVAIIGAVTAVSGSVNSTLYTAIAAAAVGP